MASQSYVLLTGPMFFATAFNWGLLGTLVVQVYFFSVLFPRERAGIKALVYSLFTLDLLQTGFSSLFSWGFLVGGWGNPGVFVTLTWPGIMVPVFSGIISAIVQIFFAWRIWTLKKGNIVAQGISILIVVIALMQGLSAMVTGIRFAWFSDITEMQKVTRGVEVWLIGSFVCDIIIAVTMIIILWNARRNSPWKRTESIVDKLIIHTVQTGAITAVTAGIELVLFLKYQDNFLHEVPAIILGKMYSNVVLATLNGRKSAILSSSQDTMMDSSQGRGETLQLSWRKGASRDHTEEQGTTIVHVDTIHSTGRDLDSEFPKKSTTTL